MKVTEGIPDRLRHARLLVDDLTLAELNRLAGLGLGIVQSIELGVRPNPTAQTIARLCKTLGVTSDWLISGAGDEPTVEKIRLAVEKARRRARKAA